MTRKRFTPAEIAFIKQLAPQCRVKDLCDALQRSDTSGLLKLMRRIGIAGRGRATAPPMASDAVKEAWRQYQAQGSISENLPYWGQESGRRMANRHRDWAQGDDESLSELVGREPIAAIAKRLKRTSAAVKARLWMLGIRHKAVEYTCSKLARRLNISPRTVNKYCHGNPPRLRSWFEGHWRVVHADDAEWLLENYKYYETSWPEVVK